MKQLEFPSIEKDAGPKFIDFTVLDKIDKKSFNDLFEKIPKDNSLEVETVKFDDKRDKYEHEQQRLRKRICRDQRPIRNHTTKNNPNTRTLQHIPKQNHTRTTTRSRH